jgi:HAMP domain-containing protein
MIGEKAGLAGSASVALVDPRGMVRWHTEARLRGQLVRAHDPELHRAVEAAGRARGPFRTTLSDGHYAAALLPTSRWTVAVLAPFEHMLAPLRRIGGWILVGMFGLLTISFPLLRRFSRRLAERMEQLSAGAAEFAAGRWQHRVPASTADEVGRLGSALNRGGSCTGRVTVCVPHDRRGAPCVDGGEIHPSYGGDATPCGPSTCPAGTFCCNVSCGICVLPDHTCTQQFCGGGPGPT